MLVPMSPTAEQLRRYSLFGGLVDAQLAMLLSRITVEELPAGAVLIREGEHGDRMWCLISGEVEVSRGGRPLARLLSGETIGEMELIDMQPRSATVTALAPCTLYALRLKDILALQRHDLPAFALVVMNLARDLSRRLRRMDGA